MAPEKIKEDFYEQENAWNLPEAPVPQELPGHEAGVPGLRNDDGAFLVQAPRDAEEGRGEGIGGRREKRPTTRRIPRLVQIQEG